MLPPTVQERKAGLVVLILALLALLGSFSLANKRLAPKDPVARNSEELLLGK